jgi:hypothetical protein
MSSIVAGFAQDALSSWNDTAAKKAIVDFVAAVKAAGITPAERIAVFDNDGTLWSEQPMYFQAFFIVDRIKALAPAASRVDRDGAVRRRAEGRRTWRFGRGREGPDGDDHGHARRHDHRRVRADREGLDCDRESHIGKLVRGLDEGPERGWVIVDMKSDWKRVYGFEEP